MDKKQYICSCFLSNNIFLKKHNLHVKHASEKQFLDGYKQALVQRGCNTEEKLEQVKKLILEEIERRKLNGKRSQWRKKIISQSYKPQHKDVYTLQESFLHVRFREIVSYAKDMTANRTGLLKMLRTWKAPGTYSLPVFTPTFCEKFVEEMKHFEQSDAPKGRPNSMNSYGVLLEELGFYPNFINVLREHYLLPIARLLFPEWCGETGLDSQRAFVVSYDCESESETDLALHYDNAEITLNVSLTESFTEGDLYFTSMRKDVHTGYHQVLHQLGHGILHRGQHLHGAMQLESGQRYNIIVWMRSSSIRNQLCPMCDEVPTLLETEGDGDGFTKLDDVVDVCSMT